MNKKLDLNDQNKITVMLVQALWGAVSPNFRMVALSLSEPTWQLLFVLEDECLADREEIEDVAAEFDALLLGLNVGEVQFDVQIKVSTEALELLNPASWRMVYRRKET